MVHAKTMLIDDTLVNVVSAGMD